MNTEYVILFRLIMEANYDDNNNSKDCLLYLSCFVFLIIYLFVFLQVCYDKNISINVFFLLGGQIQACNYQHSELSSLLMIRIMSDHFARPQNQFNHAFNYIEVFYGCL